MKNQLAFKFLPKLWTSILYLVVIAAGSFMYLSKHWDITIFTSIYSDFYLHISNFSISLILGLIPYFWLLMGAKFNYIIIFSLLLLVANALCETVLGFINTPDIIDMYFGFAGTGISFLTLLIIYKFGLSPNSEKRESQP
ncbi:MULTISPECIES: hypothetical protein [Enterococcus]|uniref:VanZ-like domain-containing protein n=1 Tax=Candidatus Enterococcus mangumiae TaxID=2230878 RepID=A0ABZ2SSB3_9ENTE|nr:MULTISPECIES: hypothetical protein [unclassified Enterococcus]MBO0460739.1 hypothetical protein [Enterococcus sp. DIV1298c]MBO0488791.1 hypothetical protein [Enterococcus sp. DIV1094]MBO1299056.1 hypothetical protein [Enterococcus sp. DIV1271a]